MINAVYLGNDSCMIRSIAEPVIVETISPGIAQKSYP